MKNARLLHYSHCVSDIEKSRKFYTDVLGFEVMAEFDFDDDKVSQVMLVPNCKFKGLFMKRDGQRIELIGFSQPPPDRSVRPHLSNEIGHSHFSFNVKDLDDTLADLAAQGVEPVPGSRAELGNGIECCVIRDPDGYPIELVSSPQLLLLPYETP